MRACRKLASPREPDVAYVSFAFSPLGGALREYAAPGQAWPQHCALHDATIAMNFI